MAVSKGILVSVHADDAPLEEREDSSIDEDYASEMNRYILAKSN